MVRRRVLSAFVAVSLALAGAARADHRILYTTQTNPAPPGMDPLDNSYGDFQTWSNAICGGGKSFPYGTEYEWVPVLDSGDAETTLVGLSGYAAYNPQPDESGYCTGGTCPAQPMACSSGFDCFSSCGGGCDMAQGPSCAGGLCISPWSKFPDGVTMDQLPIACVNDAQCATACGGTCTALGRSRGDLQMTHPFGFDYDVAIAPDPGYTGLLARGNVEVRHIEIDGQTALSGFEDIVYPYEHATTPANGTMQGWCAPKFDARCSTNADCASGLCEGVVNGLGLNACSGGFNDGNRCAAAKDCPGGGTCQPWFPGTIGMETDHDLIPDAYQPKDGDRVAVFGHWIVDCGHGDKFVVPGFHTEIHPPLLVAAGRETGGGAFGAKCSAEQSCTNVIGRPYLVSQNLGDGATVRHLEHETLKLGCLEATGPLVSAGLEVEALLGNSFDNLPDCSIGLDPTCVCNDDLGCIACEAASCAALDLCFTTGIACGGADPPLGDPCSTSIEARARVDRVPFKDKQTMQYFVEPENARRNPGDKMLVKWQLTARTGVTVGLSSAGDAGVQVNVTMDHDAYQTAPPPLPPKHDWVAFSDEIYPGFSWGGLGSLLLALVAPVQTAIADQGVFNDRYDAPSAPDNTNSPNIKLSDQLDGTMQAADIDNSQPFPLSGKLNVGWFRCSAGGPYGADCGGPRTSMTLDGSGSSDPDGNPLTYTWTGPFIGGTATGVSPTVLFSGGGTFPITLTVDNGEVSTSCTSSVTIKTAAAFELGGAGLNATGDAGGIHGDVCVGPGGSLNVTGAQYVTGNIHLAPGDPLTKSGTGSIGPVQVEDLSARIADDVATAAAFAALPCTQSFSTLKGSQVITGNGGQNVICVGDLTLNGTSTVSLIGGTGDTFIVKISGKLKLTDSSKIVGVGVLPSAIVYDVVGAGQQVVISSSGTGGPGCCNASLDGTILAVGRSVSFGPGLVHGAVIASPGISFGGGSSVQ
jgi:hypothetical protein